MDSWKFTSSNSDHSSSHSLHHSSHSASSSSAPPNRHRGLSEIMAEEDMDYARYIIKKWRVDAEIFEKVPVSSLFTDREEALKLLNATTSLQRAMNHYVKQNATSEKIIGAHELMQIAMTRLKFEFHTILSANRGNLDTESVSGSSSIDDSESGRAVEDLKMIAECMIACGYGKECINIYRINRKWIVEEKLYHLGIERLTIAQLRKMEWKILESRIKRWLHGVKIAVEIVFRREKILSDAVFSSSEKMSVACFVESSRDAALDLFAFGEDVCKIAKDWSPEKVFRLLDLYEAISDVWPEIELIFSDDLSAAVTSHAMAVQKKLGETIRAMLEQFEEAIRKESSKPLPNGGVHPLTSYVMNFLAFLCDYSSSVSSIVDEFPVKYRFSGDESDQSTAEISRRLKWLILVLLCKLDSKVEAYNDVALSYLFLANNLNYVVSKARKSNLGFLIGQNWIGKHELNLKNYLANYEKHGWRDVISAVPENRAAVMPSLEMRECYEIFFASFLEACKQQSMWVIPDPKLREQVKTSLAKRIVSGYRVSYGRGREAGLSVKYTPEDLYNYLSDLFIAAPGKSYTTSHKKITMS